MNDLEILLETYRKIKIKYVVKQDGDWTYVYLSCNPEKDERLTIYELCRKRPFMEFLKGELASY